MITGNLEKMIISSSQRIEGLLEAGFDSESLEPNSYDLRVGSKALKGGSADEQTLDHSTSITMEPGSYVAVLSAEKVRLPNNVCAFIGAKRHLSYEGVILLTGMQVHPGYEGYFVFGLFNASGKNYVLQFQQKICSITFFDVEPVPVESIQPPSKHMLVGNFDPDFKRKFADFKTQGWIGLERSMTAATAELETLRIDVKALRERVDDVYEPIRQLTHQVEKVTQDVQTVNDSVKKTAENLASLSDKHHELAAKREERTRFSKHYCFFSWLQFSGSPVRPSTSTSRQHPRRRDRLHRRCRAQRVTRFGDWLFVLEKFAALLNFGELLA